jgi:hypothetical protein
MQKYIILLKPPNFHAPESGRTIIVPISFTPCLQCCQGQHFQYKVHQIRGKKATEAGKESTRSERQVSGISTMNSNNKWGSPRYECSKKMKKNRIIAVMSFLFAIFAKHPRNAHSSTTFGKQTKENN